MNTCVSDINTIRKFLNLTEGNWRNTIYIECKACKYEPHEGCGDFLCIPDENGMPILLPICDCKILFSRYIDPSECLLWISHYRFCELYSAWLTTQQIGIEQYKQYRLEFDQEEEANEDNKTEGNRASNNGDARSRV